MTAEEFDRELEAIAEKFYGAPSTEVTENAFKSSVLSLVNSLYASGGALQDRLGPIPRFEDVEIIVYRGAHLLSASAIRKESRL